MSDTHSRQRRRRGTGSYTQVRPGVWRLRIGCGVKADGTPRYHRETVYGDLDDVDRRIVELREQLRADPTIGSGLTLEKFYEGRFKAHLDERGLTQASRDTYTYAWPHVPESWRSRELGDIPSPAEVQSWIDTMTTGTARQSMKALKAVYNYAHACGLTKSRPWDGFRFRYHEDVTTDERDESYIWDEYDMTRAIDAAHGSRLEPYLLTTCGAGLRREEALALTWGRVETTTRHGETVAWIDVREALTARDGRKTVKTRESRRRVPVTGPVAARLAALHGADDEPLVRSVRGGALGASGLGILWRKEQGAGGVLHDAPRMTANGGRASHTTLMRDLGIDASIVRAYHGHTGVGTEERHYIKRTDRALLSAARVVGDAMRDAAEELAEDDDTEH